MAYETNIVNSVEIADNIYAMERTKRGVRNYTLYIGEIEIPISKDSFMRLCFLYPCKVLKETVMLDENYHTVRTYEELG